MKIGDYVFNIGDEVITTDGSRGEIVDICRCERCAERGFFEPIWEDETGAEDYITCHEANRGFNGYHKVGKYYFHPVRRDHIIQDITYHEDMLIQARKRLTFIDELIAKEGEIAYETVE